MRIVGGKYKGRIFTPDKRFSARPTTDIAKEGLFNILDNRYIFEGKNCLDLFSGTGSIAYEFISRGCEEVFLVEIDQKHCNFIAEVLRKLEIRNVKLIRGDVFQFVPKCKREFDFVFADPPFELPRINEIPNLVIKSRILTPEGIFILEHPKNYTFTDHPNFFELRNYGKVNFSFFRVNSVIN